MKISVRGEVWESVSDEYISMVHSGVYSYIEDTPESIQRFLGVCIVYMAKPFNNIERFKEDMVNCTIHVILEGTRKSVAKSEDY